VGQIITNGAIFDEHPNRGGPFLSSAGALYFLVTGLIDVNEVHVFKSTTPASAPWTDAAAWEPVAAGTPTSVAAYQVADVLHLVVFMADGTVRYNTFTMGADTFGVGELVATTTGSTGAEYPVAIVVRSDTTVVVAYTGTPELFMSANRTRVVYARRSALGVWTGNLALSPTGTTDNHRGVHAVLGSSDRVHFFYSSEFDDDLLHKSLTVANVLSSQQNVDTSCDPDAGTVHFAGAAHAYDDGGTRRVRVMYIDADQKIAVAKANSADVPSWTFDTAVSDTTARPASTTLFAAGAMANEGTTLHLAYLDLTTVDIWRDKSAGGGGAWGTDVEMEDGVTIEQMSQGLVHGVGGDVSFALCYRDGATKWFYTADVVAEAASGATVTASLGGLSAVGVRAAGSTTAAAALGVLTATGARAAGGEATVVSLGGLTAIGARGAADTTVVISFAHLASEGFATEGPPEPEPEPEPETETGGGTSGQVSYQRLRTIPIQRTEGWAGVDLHGVTRASGVKGAAVGARCGVLSVLTPSGSKMASGRAVVSGRSAPTTAAAKTTFGAAPLAGVGVIANTGFPVTSEMMRRQREEDELVVLLRL